MTYEITNLSYDDTKNYEDRFNLDMEFCELSLNVGEMFEGIRAYFIDKDNAPKWKINSFEELDKLKLV